MEIGKAEQEEVKQPWPQPLNRLDILLALIVGTCALAAYGRTLAPGVLYGDSAEFQTLAYTLGVTHPSGYPIYLFFAKLMTFLPIQSVAWRVNFVSALCGALTLVGLYLSVRLLTRSRMGAVLGSAILGIGYTFWSQAIIAEVYTTATFCVVAVMLVLWHWHVDPTRRGITLFFACLLVGLGIHITVELVIPAMVVFVFWNLAALRLPAKEWWRSILWAVGGAALGAVIFFLAFLVLDLNNPPTSYIQVTLIPSRSAWGVQLTDLDSPLERFSATVLGLQWRRSMFSGNLPFMLGQLKQYVKWALKYDLTLWIILFALLGIATILRYRLRWGGFLLIYGAILLFLILNYEGPGKFVFYPTTYLLIALAAGTGVGGVLDRLHQFLVSASQSRILLLYPAAVVLMTLVVVLPFWGSRWQAIRAGAAQFVKDEDTYPVYNLKEPQQQAEQRLSQVEEDAVFILDWKTLYATYYVATVEQGRTGIKFMEDCINRDDHLLADTLIQEIANELHMGHPVYSDRPYPYLEQSFNFESVPGTDLVRMSLKEK